MPYNAPKKSGSGYVLPKKSGGLHKSSGGKVIHYSSASKAKSAARAIMASEHGWKPTKRA